MLAINQLMKFRPVRTISHGASSTSAAAEQTDASGDVFGTLSESGRSRLIRKIAEQELSATSSGHDELEFDLEPRKNHYYYKYEITKYARQGSIGLRRALELFHEMKAKARIEPNLNNFSPLIYGCAKAGYTKRAFDLYEESMKYSKKPSNSMITCLINSCAECPFPEYGLQRLDWFMRHIKVEYNRTLNIVQFNAAIKAYGKLGQLGQASKLIQEMIDASIYPTIDTFNMLLIGCASNKAAGCSLALRVYKRIKMYDMNPNLITYRLLLRCIRDCSMGSQKLMDEILEELPATTNLKQRIIYQDMLKKSRNKEDERPSFAWAPLLSDMGKTFSDALIDPNHCDKGLQNPCNRASKVVSQEVSDYHSTNTKSTDNKKTLIPVNSIESTLEAVPNLLSDDHLSLVSRIKTINLDRLKSSSDRILLFGGLHGYLATMMNDGCKPDNKTFSLLLDCLKPMKDNYIEFFRVAKDMGIQRDLIFYDLLIDQICSLDRLNNRLSLAMHFIDEMHLDNLRPNISTFEAIASGCENWDQAIKLFRDVERCGFVVSDIMIAKLFKVAINTSNFKYLIEIIRYVLKLKRFHPNKDLIEKLEALQLNTRYQLLKQEKSEKIHQTEELSKKIKDFDEFKSLLGHWLREVQLEEPSHPWQQFEVEHGSKNSEFRNYAKYMQTAANMKREASKRGENFGNLFEKSKKLIEAENN